MTNISTFYVIANTMEQMQPHMAKCSPRYDG